MATRRRLGWMVIVWLGTVLLWLIGGFANGSNPGSPAVMIGLAVGFWGIVLIGIAWFVARLTAPLERRTCPGCGRAVDAGRESCASCGHRIGHGALPRHSA